MDTHNATSLPTAALHAEILTLKAALVAEQSWRDAGPGERDALRIKAAKLRKAAIGSGLCRHPERRIDEEGLCERCGALTARHPALTVRPTAVPESREWQRRHRAGWLEAEKGREWQAMNPEDMARNAPEMALDRVGGRFSHCATIANP